jgi:hypothetical protein
MCVMCIDFASVSTIFQLDFGIVPTVWYFFFNLSRENLVHTARIMCAHNQNIEKPDYLKVFGSR